MSGNTVCFRTLTKSLTFGFVEGTNNGNDWIQLFCCIRELWKWLKNPPLYIFYQQINNSVSVSASPSVVIASGQPAVSDTDGVLKPGGWGRGGGTAGGRVLLLTFIQSLMLTTLWSFQLSVKMMKNGRWGKMKFTWFLFRPVPVLNVQWKAV